MASRNIQAFFMAGDGFCWLPLLLVVIHLMMLEQALANPAIDARYGRDSWNRHNNLAVRITAGESLEPGKNCYLKKRNSCLNRKEYCIDEAHRECGRHKYGKVTLKSIREKKSKCKRNPTIRSGQVDTLFTIIDCNPKRPFCPHCLTSVTSFSWTLWTWWTMVQSSCYRIDWFGSSQCLLSPSGLW